MLFVLRRRRRRERNRFSAVFQTQSSDKEKPTSFRDAEMCNRARRCMHTHTHSLREQTAFFFEGGKSRLAAKIFAVATISIFITAFFPPPWLVRLCGAFPRASGFGG